MKSINYEDMIMKRAMDVFAEEGLKFFGIEKKVKEVSSTEIIVLEAKNMFMDYTFLMEDDTYIHIEFQTTDKGIVDLRRFKAYESLFELQMNKDIVTYVVYSGNIKNPLNCYKSGLNTYNVKAISMASKDGDKVFDEIVNKIKNNDKIEKQDLITLTFTPIMGGKLDKVDRILNAIKIVRSVDTEYRYDIETILYAFANKFLEGKDLEKVEEELSMTELGKRLMERGESKKVIEIVKNSIKNGLDNEMISSITGLTAEKIQGIREAIEYEE